MKCMKIISYIEIVKITSNELIKTLYIDSGTSCCLNRYLNPDIVSELYINLFGIQPENDDMAHYKLNGVYRQDTINYDKIINDDDVENQEIIDALDRKKAIIENSETNKEVNYDV